MTVQDVMRLEQFALTSVDVLREGLGKARLKLAESSVPQATGSGEAPGALEVGHYQARKKELEEEEAYKAAIQEMQEEMQELEKELFLGPGVEMGHSGINVGDPDAAKSGGYVAGLVRSHAGSAGPTRTSGIGGRGPSCGGGDPFQMPFDYPLNPHPRGTPTATPEPPWQYVPASAYVPMSTKSPRGKEGGGGRATPQKSAWVDAASSTAAPRTSKRR